MAFANQYTLTLELARLLPSSGFAAHEPADTIINVARDLRYSGSDLVVERDLASVFGRCRISEALSSSFRTVLAHSSSSIPLIEDITLHRGPGPTVLRAFQELPYFSTIVQLSLLVWTFNVNYSAAALAESLRRRALGAPPSSVLQMSPDESGILGVLKACESQTSFFNWNMLLDAVSTTLDYEAEGAPKDFPQFVLQGLLDIFPMVQTLPKDRIIHIQIPVGEKLESGIPALIVWAHHVLDLTVLVQTHGSRSQSPRNIRFRNSESEKVFIEEVSPEYDSSITLLDSQKKYLFEIQPAPGSEFGLIGTSRRIPARGWGNALLKDSMSNFKVFNAPSEAVIEDLQIVTCAFAFIIAKHLVKNESSGNTDEDMTKMRIPIDIKVDQHCLLQAARFLFNNVNLSRGEIDIYVGQYSSRPLGSDLPRPPALERLTRIHDDLPTKVREIAIKDEWDMICGHARTIAVLILALAHVVGLEDCGDLMLYRHSFDYEFEYPLTEELQEWGGMDSLRVTDDDWLQAIAIPLLGDQNRIWIQPWGPWKNVCLVSDRGWSAWISTLANSDPAYTNASSIHLGRGSPCRNGIWRTGTWDTGGQSCYFDTDPERAESCGQVASLRSAHRVTLETPYCEVGEDAFLVCARFRLLLDPPKRSSVQRCGYKELQRCLWWAQISERCSHGSLSHDSITLSVGCATLAGFGNRIDGPDERILIFLTAHNVGARWLTLATLPQVHGVGGGSLIYPGARQFLIRRDNCCFQCVIDQATARPGKWFVIL